MKTAPWQSQELRRQLAGQASAAPQQATAKTKLGVSFVRGSAERVLHNGTTGQTCDIPRQLDSSTRIQKSPRSSGPMTHEDQILIPLSELGRARCLRPRGRG